MANDKQVTIIINGQEHQVEKTKHSYQDIINLAFDGSPPAGEFIVITVTYAKGEDGKQGSMEPGDEVNVKDGMVFNVTATDKS